LHRNEEALMRIVHTSDWHAGHIWKSRNRLGEFETILDDLAEFIEHERVDLLLLSGDIFDSGAPAAEAERVVFRFLRRIGRAGTRTVAVAGNHDSAVRMEAWGTLAELVDVYAVGLPRAADRGGVITIPGRTGERAVVAAVPWTPARNIVGALEIVTDERGARQHYARWMKQLIEHLSARFASEAINLLIAHAHINGALLSGSERKAHLGEGWVVSPRALASRAHYVALGHIHRPQMIEAAPSPACYAGSPVQLDFGEAGEEKSFVVIDAHPGQDARIERIPYRGGIPLGKVRATLTELEQEADALSKSGWLKVMVPLAAPDPDLGAKVRRLLPNAVAVDYEPLWDEVVPPRLDHRGLAPAELFRIYFRDAHGTEPNEALIEAFRGMHEMARGRGQ
jgi:DNA repair protein SbcD/Mre11